GGRLQFAFLHQEMGAIFEGSIVHARLPMQVSNPLRAGDLPHRWPLRWECADSSCPRLWSGFDGASLSEVAELAVGAAHVNAAAIGAIDRHPFDAERALLEPVSAVPVQDVPVAGDPHGRGAKRE